MKRGIRNLFLFALGVGIIGVAIGLYLYTKKAPDLLKVKADFTLSVSELTNEFSQDETSASARYIDKIVEVTGPVASIEATSDSTMNVTLTEEGELSGVICTFHNTSNPAWDKIKEGETITVRGVCSGMLMDVLLNNCVVVQ